PAYGPQNDVTLKMPAFEWVHVQLHQQKGMISLSPPTICNSALSSRCLNPPDADVDTSGIFLRDIPHPERIQAENHQPG
ncbi:hypothetical protein, partial [Escherichia coli]|uniref:hypothetical protein n=1 Tax=Escherichia coli TaxID=562 RepID=UPI00390B8581